MQFMIFNKNPVLSIELVENVGLASAEVPKGFFIHLRCIGTCYVVLEDLFICQLQFFFILSFILLMQNRADHGCVDFDHPF